ncbi:unnamed protein product [Arctogadus glacialis]
MKREDTERALQAITECQTGAAEGFKDRAEKLLNIFQSDLFQALLDIQEFYELTVCESLKAETPPDMKYRYHGDDTPPLEDSSGHMTASAGHMTEEQSVDSTHSDGYAQPAAHTME